MITAITRELQKLFYGIKINDTHLYEHFEARNACFVAPDKPVSCRGKLTLNTYLCATVCTFPFK